MREKSFARVDWSGRAVAVNTANDNQLAALTCPRFTCRRSTLAQAWEACGDHRGNRQWRRLRSSCTLGLRRK